MTLQLWKLSTGEKSQTRSFPVKLEPAHDSTPYSFPKPTLKRQSRTNSLKDQLDIFATREE